MDLRGFVVKRQGMLAIMIWVKIGLWWSLIQMLRSMTYLCLLANGVLVRCLVYSTVHLQKYAINSIKISKIASNQRVLLWTHLVDLEYLTAEWTKRYIKKVTPTYRKGQ